MKYLLDTNVLSDFARGEPFLRPERGMIEGRLRCGAKENRATQLASQLVQHAARGRYQTRWQGLAFVENDDAASDVVQLAAARGTVREQAFEQLHIGGDD